MKDLIIDIQEAVARGELSTEIADRWNIPLTWVWEAMEMAREEELRAWESAGWDTMYEDRFAIED